MDFIHFNVPTQQTLLSDLLAEVSVAIAAIQGTQSTKCQDNNFAHIDLAVAEGNVVAEGHVPSA